MTLKELQYLVALADQGRFGRAAEACHVGQPTLSTQLKKLEDYLGVTLFERNKHYLIPTPVGEQIIERARIALDVVEPDPAAGAPGRRPDGRVLAPGRDPDPGPLPGAAPPADAAADLSPAAPVPARGPDGQPAGTARAGTARCAAAGVAPARRRRRGHGAVSRALLGGAARRPRAGAARTRSSEEELAGQNVLLLEEGHCMRDQALAICGSTASDEREELKATSLETLRQMVAAGVGLYLAAGAGQRCRGWGRCTMAWCSIRPFASPAPTRLIGMAWRHRYPREKTMKRLAEVVLASLPAAVEPVKPASDPSAGRGAGPTPHSAPSAPDHAWVLASD